jgi:membrane protein
VDKFIKKLLSLKEMLWKVEKLASPFSNFFFQKFRVVYLALKCFFSDKCALRGSALTFYVLMSLVPMAAMAFGVAKGFNLDKKLETLILSSLSQQSEVITKVIQFARNILNETRADIMAIIGLFMLFWSVIKVLTNIEISFNEIWGVKEHRTLARKFTDYLSIIFLAPLCIFAAGTFNLFVQSFLDDLMQQYYLISYFSFAIKPALRLIPFFLLTAFFSFTYLIVPNTKVNFKSAFFGGAIASVLYQLLQILYFSAQAEASKSNPIYGSFAALPLFLMWLQFSWYILLLGAEVAFASQNMRLYIYESETESITPRLLKISTVYVLKDILLSFLEEKPSGNVEAMANKLNLPIRLMGKIISTLEKSKLIIRVDNGDGDTNFIPITTVEKYDFYYVFNKLEDLGSTDIPLTEDDSMSHINEIFDGMYSMIKDSDLNKKIYKI